MFHFPYSTAYQIIYGIIGKQRNIFTEYLNNYVIAHNIDKLVQLIQTCALSLWAGLYQTSDDIHSHSFKLSYTS